ncbi:MAG: YbaB/EbfC family nucleoid-associated protein, partial [Fusobacteria bacterium]|nr:YbaB/EbfC family nucleoid-associated protein [Fusobacteriota bacterium]
GTGNGSTQDFVKQAQMMQAKMQMVQDELATKELEASVGGGQVTVRVNGQKELLAVKISEELVKEVVAENDIEMLEDLILTAVKEAMRQAEELGEREMSQVTAGVNIPGLI